MSLGPDFCEAPTKIPFEKIISTTEKMCTKILDEGKDVNKDEDSLRRETNKLRESMKKLLEKERTKKFQTNLTKQQQTGKKKIKTDKEKVFLPADKGRIMVAMDRYESEGGENRFEFKMKQVLVDLKATPSVRAGKDWDLTQKVCRDGIGVIDNIIARGEINEKYRHWLKPKHCPAPRLTGYPKIHKDNIPLRGVVSMIGSPFENLSKHLIPILRSIQGRSGLYIRNSRELKEIVKEWRVERNEVLVSYDVKNLYPSIPIKEALELVEVLLKGKPNLSEVTPMSVTSIMQILRWMFSLTYCEYNGKHFILNSGPIGLGATGEIAVIYMEEFQMKAMKTSPYTIGEWPWYVDDYETKSPGDQTEATLNHLNSIEEGSSSSQRKRCRMIQ